MPSHADKDDSDGQSVQQVLNQIESFNEEDEDEGIFIEVTNQQIGIQAFPSLTKLDENCILERFKPFKRPREVLPPAIVDLSSAVDAIRRLSPKVGHTSVVNSPYNSQGGSPRNELINF